MQFPSSKTAIVPFSHTVSGMSIHDLVTPYSAWKITRFTDGTSYILDTLAAENTQQEFTLNSRFSTVCVQRLFAILHDHVSNKQL